MICLYIGGARVEDRKKREEEDDDDTYRSGKTSATRYVLYTLYYIIIYIILYASLTHSMRIRSDFVWIYRQAVYYFDHIIYLYGYIYTTTTIHA